MNACPWCKNYTLQATRIRIGDSYIVIEPHRCQKCGAQEISLYSVADGWIPTPEEFEKGYYTGENVHRHRLDEDSNHSRRKSRRRIEEKRLQNRNKSCKRK